MAAVHRPIRAGRTRTVALAFFAIVFLFFYLPSTWRRPLESERLAHLMNHGAGTPPAALESTSSFDWSTVPFKYPPNETRPLPRGRPLSLPRVQHVFPPETPAQAQLREARRDEVRRVFQRAWRSYRTFAWKKDALLPLTAGYVDQFSGWAATLVDSLDTLWIMGLREEFDEAVAATAQIDFGRSTTDRVNTFETTIRYLGGLLSAYDLSGRELLLRKAVELGDMMYAGFNTPNRMQVDFLEFTRAKTGEGLLSEASVVSASPGTLSMELTRLSQVTGDPKYYSAAALVMDVFERGQTQTRLPGMWPTFVSMRTQDVTTGSSFTLGGCADSLYEYLPKMYALVGGLEERYRTMTSRFFLVADQHFFFRPMLPGGEDVLISGNVDIQDDGEIRLDPESEHLTCFIGGLFALGGRLLGKESWVETGARLARGCAYTYRAMPTGMGPERFNMVKCASRTACQWDERVWDEEKGKRPQYRPHLPKGFTTAKDPRYILRPEAIESVFVLWRVTGEREWQDAAWDMFVAVSNGTRTEWANAAVRDVTVKREGGEGLEDYMESFWLAETLKYFYLAFSPPDVISLDDYVFNTEAHPFKRPKGPMPIGPLKRARRSKTGS